MKRFSSTTVRAFLLFALSGIVVGASFKDDGDAGQRVPPDRREVVFWHFWGGKDRPIVEGIVRRFNASQNEHFVRAVAMPGHNLDLKFFLSVSGEDPPDVLNQDDPVIADWAERDALTPLDRLASPGELARLRTWLFPPAREIGSYRGQLFALCNGLDVRALYYDRRILDDIKRPPPRTIAELDELAELIAPPEGGPHRRYGYLPDPRRLWAWGIVFGGSFYDPETEQVTADSDEIVRALEWMASYSRRYGADRVAAFRKGDQSLTGAAFPLLEGRYAMVMDGQWRVAEMAAAQRAARLSGAAEPQYGVAPLPYPPGGRPNAGWINGNFFVVPRGAKNPQGAWAFMKYWSGFDGHEQEAAEACAAGGWIPSSAEVVKQPRFQKYLGQYPAFRTFVELAGSPNQVPYPPMPGAAYFQQEINQAAEAAIYKNVPAREALETAASRVRDRLRREKSRK